MYTEAWIPPALVALSIWGVTAFLPKILLQRLQPLQMIVFSSIFFFLTACAVQLFHLNDFHYDKTGVIVAVATGACGSFGQIFYLEALRRGPVTYVSMISSLYPLVATLLAFLFLREPLTIKQTLSIALGIGAIVLLVVASDKKPAAKPKAETREHAA